LLVGTIKSAIHPWMPPKGTNVLFDMLAYGIGASTKLGRSAHFGGNHEIRGQTWQLDRRSSDIEFGANVPGGCVRGYNRRDPYTNVIPVTDVTPCSKE
jgi:hypothetical protein